MFCRLRSFGRSWRLYWSCRAMYCQGLIFQFHPHPFGAVILRTFERLKPSVFGIIRTVGVYLPQASAHILFIGRVKVYHAQYARMRVKVGVFDTPASLKSIVRIIRAFVTRRFLRFCLFLALHRYIPYRRFPLKFGAFLWAWRVFL